LKKSLNPRLIKLSLSGLRCTAAEAVAEALVEAFQEQIATRADILIRELRASLDKIAVANAAKAAALD
jgi:hypothetical protein